MQRRIRILCSLVFSVAFAIAFLQGHSVAFWGALASAQEDDDPDALLISALDDCIQQRFQEVDKGFGLRRVTQPGETPHRFKPEQASEMRVVEELIGARLKVVLYLAGRSVLGPKPDETRSFFVESTTLRYQDKSQPREKTPVKPLLTLRQPIKGPVHVTPYGLLKADLPKPMELWEPSQKAMKAFETSDQYNFALGEWKFSARPVRASNQSCLKCHVGDTVTLPFEQDKDHPSQLLKVGDPLGVVVYGYARLR